MAENLELTAPQMQNIDEIGEETSRKKVINPRVEIDTSPPFESVKEAVTHFGGGGAPWIPLHLLRLASDHTSDEFDMDKMEEQATQLEKDLIVKEQETLDILKELEAAKRFVEGLKMNLIKDVSALVASPASSPSSLMSTPDNKSMDRLSLCRAPSPGLVSMELNQAKFNLNKTTTDLAVIRASVESLNKKMTDEKILTVKSSEMEVPNSIEMLTIEENHNTTQVKPQKVDDAETIGGFGNQMNISRELPELNFEAEQFKNMTEAARYEVTKAMSEIERTKTTINMVEMRLMAAKKMEEAARAVEAVASAERKALLNGKSSSDFQNLNGITLSIEEYFALTQKAQKAEELSKMKVVETSAKHCINEQNLSKDDILKKLVETNEEIKHSTKSLEQVLDKVGITNRRELVPEDDSCIGKLEHDDMRHSGYNSAKFKFRNSFHSRGQRDSQPPDANESDIIKDKSVPVFRSAFSIGDLLSRKLILQDDIVVGRHIQGDTERQGVSLSQMLREKSGLILNPPKTMKVESVNKEHLAQRKKFGFIHVSLGTRQSKKKMEALNLR